MEERLCSYYVELSAAKGACSVQRNSFHADEVVAARKSLRQGEGYARHVLSGEADATTAIGDWRDLVDLEPDGAIARPGRRIRTRGYFCHVYVHNAWVVDRAAISDHEADLLAGVHGQGSSRRVRRCVVAAEVGRRDIGHLVVYEGRRCEARQNSYR